MSDNQTPLCVLMIEDDPDAQAVVIDVLSFYGMTLWIANDLDSAIKAIKDHNPDVILLDIFLRDTTGYKILQAIRALEDERTYPVVACTGYYTTDTAETLASYGFDGYLLKPYDPKQLISALYESVGSK